MHWRSKNSYFSYSELKKYHVCNSTHTRLYIYRVFLSVYMGHKIFDWNLFVGLQSMIDQHWFKKRHGADLAPIWRRAISWINDYNKHMLPGGTTDVHELKPKIKGHIIKSTPVDTLITK